MLPASRDLTMAVAHVGFSVPIRRNPEAAGISFESNVIRDFLTYGRTFLADVGAELLELYQNLQNVRDGYTVFAEDNDDALDTAQFDSEDDPLYVEHLTSLDPTRWRDYDLYRILGLSKLRHNATLGQIRSSYRRKVLKFHPDKRMAASDSLTAIGHDSFACISKAYDALSCPKTRMAYDSVDPYVDDTVPGVCQSSRENFFSIFGDAFRRNSRWSTVADVPDLGGPDDSEQKVNDFYNFWYSFPSWRVFTWNLEEDPTKAECREERRWMEKSMKASQEPLRRKEVRRIRTLVDNAYKSDPRIEQFKNREKERRQEAKEHKRLAKQRALDEMMKAQEAERLQLLKEKEAEEERQRLKAIEEKRKKTAVKKMQQKERKVLTDLVESSDYFGAIDKERLSIMEALGRVCTALPADKLQRLNREMMEAGHDPTQQGRVFVELATQLLDEQAKEELRGYTAAVSTEPVDGAASPSTGAMVWCKEETQLLVRAMSQFPAGSKQRWSVIADFINEHRKATAAEPPKTAKQVAAMVKSLERTSISSAKQTIVSDNLLQSKGQAEVAAPPSMRYSSQDNAWTADEQKRLEQALKRYPASLSNRWDLIGLCLPERGKAECMRRYKEIAQLVRARRLLAAATADR